MNIKTLSNTILSPSVDKIKKSIYIQYTLVFIIFFFFAFSPFIIYDKAFLWGSDGIAQHYPTLLYTKEWVSSIITSIFENGSFTIPFWDLRMGFGQDVIGNVINFRLFNFLYFFFDESNIEFYLFLRSFLSLYLCGLSFIFFAKKKSDHSIAIIIGTMVYIFSGFSLYFAARHTFFLEMMFYLPLLLSGVDSIFHKKKSALFIFIVFLSSISYSYFLYMITIPAFIYALFLYFITVETKTLKSFWNILKRFIWQYGLGLLLSAFSLLPSILRTLSSGRVSGESGLSLIHWDSTYYLDFIKGIINMQEIGNYGFIAFSGITLYCILFMFFEKNKENLIYRRQFLIYIVAYLFPFMVLAFNGFSGRTQRWNFILIFWSAMIIVKTIPQLLEKKNKVFIKSFICMTIYSIIYYFVILLTNDDLGIEIIWIIIYTCILMLVNFSNLFRRHKKQLLLTLLPLLCLEVTFKSYDLYTSDNLAYMKSFIDKDKLNEVSKDNPSYILKDIDDELHRNEVISGNLSKKYNQNNYGLRNNIYGISSYYSFSEGRIAEYSLNLGNSQQNVPFLILDWDQRAALNALSSVKYLGITEASKSRVPYGYIPISTNNRVYSNGITEKETLYENQYYLPLMFTYDSYISSNDYKKYDANEKEQAMLQGAVLEKDINYPKTSVEFDYNLLLNKQMILQQLKDDYIKSETIEIYDDHFLVKEDGVTITISVPLDKQGEVYCLIKDVTFESINLNNNILGDLGEYGKKYVFQNLTSKYLTWRPDSVSTIIGEMGGSSDTGSLLNNTNQYYFGKRDLLLNLGYMKTQNLTLKFSKSGVYKFSDLRLIVQPMDQFEYRINQLKTVPVTDISLIDNGITGKISNSEKRLVQISIPYSQGWKATVNGKETEIYVANGMYMAVLLDAGNNIIVLQYETPGFISGLKITSITFIGILIYVFIRNKNSIIKKRILAFTKFLRYINHD